MLRRKAGKRIVSILMAQAMVFSLILTCGTNVRAAAPAGSDTTDEPDKVDKEEVVYVITDSEGEVDQIIVNDRLANGEGQSTLDDETDLTEIENVKGDEEYTEGEGNASSWAAEGNEISYEGKSSKELPVDVKLSFTLDGKKISGKQLAGKSGKVTIRFDYTNKEKRKVTVKGKEYDVYVPFTLMSGAILDADRFSNVSVKNGKAVKEGDRIIVFGYAVPGLKESLDIGEGVLKDSDIDIPEYVQITADVKDFEMDMTMTAVTNDLLSQMDMEKAGGEDMEKDMDDLSDATDKLVDGSKDLADAMGTASKGTKTISESMSKVSKGTKSLKQAIGQYTNGVGQLNDKVPSLTNGVTVLDTGVSKLAKGAASLKTGTSAYVQGVDSLALGLLGDGTEENPGYLAGVQALADGASNLSALEKLGDVSDAVSLMKDATGTEETYTQADGNEGATLGYGASAVEAGLDQVIQGVNTLKNSTSGQALKGLAGSLSTAATTLGTASTTVSTAATNLSTAQSNASTAISNAVTEIGNQASNVDTAKGELEEKQKEINGAIDAKNKEISSRNTTISNREKAINDAAGKCNTGIDNTVKYLGDAKKKLESAKKTLKENGASEEELKELSDEITSLSTTIETLSGEDIKVDTVELKSISEISASDVSLDLTGIKSETLSGYKDTLNKVSISALSIDTEKQTISGIASAFSTASENMTSDPLNSLITSLQQVKTGASGVKTGISSLHSSLVTLDKSTSGFPTAAQGITALNAGFTTLTKNNGTIRTGAQTLVKNGDSLNKGAKEVAEGAVQLAAGSQTLSAGASQLSKGVGTLASNNDALNKGAGDLSQGTSQLSKGAGTLSTGMGKLLKGALALNTGMAEYKKEGISQIIDLFQNDVLGLQDRFEAIRKAGKDYQIYTLLPEGEKGSVKFIYKSDEIKSEENKE